MSDDDDEYLLNEESLSSDRPSFRKREIERERAMKKREENAFLHGEIPHKKGPWPILLQSEEAELIRTIVEWPDDDCPPAVSHIPLLVLLFLNISPFISSFVLGCRYSPEKNMCNNSNLASSEHSMGAIIC
jgi:hypothetical protein